MRIFALLLAMAGLFAGCSSVHKLINKDKKTVDSTAAVVRDSSYKTVQAVRSDDLELHNVDVTVYFGQTTPTPADSALAAAKAKPANVKAILKGVVDRNWDPKTPSDKFQQVINDAIRNLGQAGNIAAVNIHVDDISDSASRSVRVDSGAARSTQKTQVKSTDTKVDKNITRTSPVWIIYLSIGIGILLIVLFILWKLKKL